MSNQTINIFQSKNVQTWGDDDDENITRIPVESFTQEVENFYNGMTTVFANLNDEQDGFKLDEIIINAEVSASGKVGFLGTGVEAGIKGSLSFKLTKK